MLRSVQFRLLLLPRSWPRIIADACVAVARVAVFGPGILFNRPTQ